MVTQRSSKVEANRNTAFDKRIVSKQKHKRAKPLGWTWAFKLTDLWITSLLFDLNLLMGASLLALAKSTYYPILLVQRAIKSLFHYFFCDDKCGFIAFKSYDVLIGRTDHGRRNFKT